MPDPLLHGWPANCPTHNGPTGHRIVTMQQIELVPLGRAACSNNNLSHTPHSTYTIEGINSKSICNKLLF